MPFWPQAVFGGVLIGAAASLLWWMNGRIAGVSGILGSALFQKGGRPAWKWCFLGGLIVGGFFLNLLGFPPFNHPAPTRSGMLLLAGFLVGLGSALASGCTSGHGVCGVARLAPRSIVAVLCFMITGFVVATVFYGMWHAEFEF